MKKILLITALAGAVLYLLLIFGWLSRHDMPDYYVGTVIQVTGKDFIVTRNKEKRVVVLGEDTHIRKGRILLKDGIHVGDRVIIAGFFDDQGQFKAKLVRILEQNKNDAQ